MPKSPKEVRKLAEDSKIDIVDLASVIEEALDTVRPAAQAKQIQLYAVPDQAIPANSAANVDSVVSKFTPATIFKAERGPHRPASLDFLALAPREC